MPLLICLSPAELHERKHSCQSNDEGPDEQDDVGSCHAWKPTKEFQSQFLYSPLPSLKRLASYQLYPSLKQYQSCQQHIKTTSKVSSGHPFPSPFANPLPILLFIVLTGPGWMHNPAPRRVCNAASKSVRQSPPSTGLTITCKPWLWIGE